MAPIRMSGMNSGLDTESIVKALVSGYETKKQKVEKNQTKLEWSQEIWKGVNSKVYSLYTGLDKVRFSSSYKSKKTSVSDPSKATVTAGSGAVNGTQKLKITKMASAGYLTGANIKTDMGDKVTSSTKLSDLGVQSGSQVNLASDDDLTAISIDDDMTVGDFVSKLREGGVNASFDENNGRFFISAKESGAEHDFKLTGLGDSGVAALKSLGLFTKSEEDVAALEKTKSYGTFSSDGTLDKDATKADIISQLSSYRSRFESATGAVVAANSAYNEVNSQIRDIQDKIVERDGIVKYLNNKKTVLDATNDGTLAAAQAKEESARTDEEKALVKAAADVEAYENAANAEGASTDVKYYVREAKAAFEANNSSRLSGLANYNTNTIIAGYNTQLADLDSQLTEKQTAIDEAKSALANVKTDMSANELLSPYADFFATMGAGVTDAEISARAEKAVAKIESAVSSLNEDSVNGATRIKGEDAEIYLNGAKFTSDSNNFNINGLSINLTGVTGDDEISITTSTDVDAIYDKVKDFVTQYSDLINELQGMYNADAAKDYEPLTEDQKAEMSETEIEKWETKIKDALLRRDSTLGGVISTMSTAMSQGYTVTMKDGTKQSMALSSLGIHTLGFLNAKTNEQYALHIDGDEEDEKTSASTDKLRAMIESDPDAVADLMSQVAQGLYKALDTKIGAKSTEMSSAYTLYNDKQMTSQIDQYKKDVKEWDERIADTEDMYYKRFTAMEKALANINSTQTALTGMIG